MQKHLPQKLTKLDSQETWHTPDNWEQIQKAGLLPTRCFSKYVANVFKESCKNFKNHSSRLRKAQNEYRQRADGVLKLSKILKEEILQFDKVVAVYVHFRQHPAICIVFPLTALPQRLHYSKKVNFLWGAGNTGYNLLVNRL
jgi:hypothetical protein